MARASRSDREGGRFDLHTANKKGGLAHLARASRSDREGGRFDLHTDNKKGGLAHLARALAWQARGDRFESDILHKFYNKKIPKHKHMFGYFHL